MLDSKSGAGLVSGVAPHSKGSTMLIYVKRGFVFEGKDIRGGDQVEVPEKFARQMIQLGRAEIVSDQTPKKKAGRPKKGE